MMGCVLLCCRVVALGPIWLRLGFDDHNDGLACAVVVQSYGIRASLVEALHE